MSGVNRVTLLGRLGRDPETKDAKGIKICNFSIATSKSWKDDSGAKQERTEWHNIVCFKRLAEIAGQYLAKGRQVYIDGELQTRSWEKDGVKHYRTEVVARDIQFVGDKAQSQAGADQQTNGQDFGSEPQFDNSDNSDEIPF